MKILFITPSEVASGEAITALQMAETLSKRGDEVQFLASPFTAAFLNHSFSEQVINFTESADQNRRIWDSTVARFKPDIIVFADYPLLFFSGGSSRLANDSWVLSLDNLDAVLVTLDHLGYAQKPMSLYFGPPHLSLQLERTPELPAHMCILLPCPVQEPLDVPERKGLPFRYWDFPLEQVETNRREFRRMYLLDEQELLILHSTPMWAWRFAHSFGLPYFLFLTKILEYYFSDLPSPVTLISVNQGDLLKPPSQPNLRLINLSSLSKIEYERLLRNCDLMITENAVSVSLGKALCSLRPCAVLRNSYGLNDLLTRAEEPLRRIILEMERERMGAIYPYEVFPIWGREDLDLLGIFKGNSLTEAFATVEIFGGAATRDQFHRLLLHQETRDTLQARQEAYVRRLAELEDTGSVISRLVGAES